MRWRRNTAVGLACLSLLACQGAFTSPPEPLGSEGVKPPCGDFGELLAITPMRVEAGAGQLVVLTGHGGTRNYRWSLAENASGAEIDTNTGVYVAGAPIDGEAETRDVVLLEDRGCRGEAAATIRVVPAPAITPRSVAVQPGERITFEGSGGSGTYSLELAVNLSGATVEGLVYTAGSRTGRDVVRLHDTALGSSADASVEVAEGAGLALATTEWVVPVDSEVAFPLTGGSGEYRVDVSGDAIAHAGAEVVKAIAPGTAEITFTDRFTTRAVTARVRVVASHEAERRFDSDRSEMHVVVSGTYDIDGDGYYDAVVGSPDESGTWFAAGTVRIYRGVEGGLDPTPVRVLEGGSRDEELGSAVALADLDGDGLLDLLVGARRADALRVDVGAVYVYPGIAGGFFSPLPIRAWYGQSSSDLFGNAIAVCDFNADGHLDVAVGALYGQQADGETDQGVVRVFLARPGSASGFAGGSDITLAGRVRAGDGWAPARTLLFGESIAAGDFDGDGACDLAVSSRGPTAEQFPSGAVTLYRGRAGDGADRGGLELEPSLFWGRADGEYDNSRFGLRLALEDVNGDGKADLVAGRYLHDGADGTDTGAVYVLYGGRALEASVTRITDIAEADWSTEGLAQDRVGNDVAVVDVDGDGRADIVSGDSRAQEMDGELSRPGIVRVWRGGALDAPAREYVGPSADGRFGIGLGAIADLDGDGWRELLVFAPYHDTSETENDDRGALFLQRSGGARPTELGLGHVASGQRVGESTAWIGDLDGDGFPELAVGASQADVTNLGRNVGVVRIYRGTATGTSSAPSQVLSGFTSHKDSDFFGWAVAPAGDFDGDGVRDLAVVAQYGDLTSLSADRYVAGDCSGSRTNSGAAFVFRGKADGTVASEPSFVIFGPETSQLMDSVAGDIDVDGDGRADLILGGYRWDAGGTNAGGHMVIRGRAADPERIVAICTPSTRMNGDENNGYHGWAVTGIGDLNGDGCDEYAVGSPAADPSGRTNAGEVRVIFPACGAEHPSQQIVRLYGNDNNAYGGRALAGGADVDGDGKPDLLVGLPRYRDERGEIGRVILVTGAYIMDLLENRGRNGLLLSPFSSARLNVDGTSPGEGLGSSVALIRRDGGGGLAVLGGPQGAIAGRVDTGGALVYDVGASGFATAPRLWVSGETLGDSNLGAAVAAARAAGGAFLAVGAPYSTAGPSSGRAYCDDGASYAFTLP